MKRVQVIAIYKRKNIFMVLSYREEHYRCINTLNYEDINYIILGPNELPLMLVNGNEMRVPTERPLIQCLCTD